MAYKLIISPEAYRDINEIITYFARDLKNIQNARCFLDNVENSCRLIAEKPSSFSLCGDGRLQWNGYRRAVIQDYLILYRADEAANTVVVICMVYGTHDAVKYL